MIDVKFAIKAAADFLATVMDGATIDQPRLEEVEFLDDGDWLVTLSLVRPDASLSPAERLVGRLKREYKVLRVSGADGSVRSMKMLQTA